MADSEEKLGEYGQKLVDHVSKYFSKIDNTKDFFGLLSKFLISEEYSDDVIKEELKSLKKVKKNMNNEYIIKKNDKLIVKCDLIDDMYGIFGFNDESDKDKIVLCLLDFVDGKEVLPATQLGKIIQNTHFTDDDIQKTKELYAKVAPSVLGVINDDMSLLKTITIGRLHNMPLLQILVDAYTRARLETLLKSKLELTPHKWGEIFFKQSLKPGSLLTTIVSSVAAYLSRYLLKHFAYLISY